VFLRVDANSGIPLGVQIGNGLRLAIVAQRIRAGEQLPSARDLAAELRVNFHTVRKVYGELEAEGLLESRRGLGTFVVASQRSSAAELRRVVRRHVEALLQDLAGGTLDADAVREAWLEEWERQLPAKRGK
jgi:DNA-binding transcriptional regulator YhcF (GntR family)